MIALIVLLAVAAVVLGAWAASTTLESRSGTRQRMSAMDHYEIADVRAGEIIRARLFAALHQVRIRLQRGQRGGG